MCIAIKKLFVTKNFHNKWGLNYIKLSTFFSSVNTSINQTFLPILYVCLVIIRIKVAKLYLAFVYTRIFVIIVIASVISTKPDCC